MRTFWIFCVVLLSVPGDSACGFIIDPSTTPWTRTASGTRQRNGQAATLTWSFVPDGTLMTDGDADLGGSDLIAFLNEAFDGAPEEPDHRKQPWFGLFEQSFGRWEELSGLDFVYEPMDDGGRHNNRRGVLGVRGDIRLGGASIDGPGSTLAFNFFPQFGGDMALDTDETSFARSSRNHLFLRNTVMHELGHAFGLSHVRSDTDRLLLEPFTDTSIDGPQLDDVRGVQYFFGDRFEAGSLAGNGTLELASALGTLSLEESLVVGADADRRRQRVSAGDTDFVSISNGDDVDVYTFGLPQAGELGARLVPLGGVFNQAGEVGTPQSFDASARSNLSLEIVAASGETLLLVDEGGLGEAEEISGLSVAAGSLFARVRGADPDAIQMYSLELSLTGVLGDCNGDGVVDAADLDCVCGADVQTVLAELNVPAGDLDADGEVAFSDFLRLAVHFGEEGTYADGDLDCSGRVDFPDFLMLANRFGERVQAGSATLTTPVPEPAGLGAAVVALLPLLLRRRVRSRHVANLPHAA